MSSMPQVPVPEQSPPVFFAFCRAKTMPPSLVICVRTEAGSMLTPPSFAVP